MALSILDGNQSATTLSTILSSGQHITAHTVISLGTQAITDVRSAVSGSVVSISNFPASQSTTFGAVTGSVSVLNFPASQSVTFGATTGSVSVLNFPASQAVTFTDASLTNTQLRASAVTVGGTVTVGNSLTISSLPAISGTVTVGNTVTIAGTVTANLTGTQTISGSVTIGAGTAQIGSVTVGNSITIGNFPATQAVSLASVPTHGVTLASTTVTVSALPRPTWTNYSGTVTTANTAITAISTTTRSYLLAQVTTGQMFINIGATATSMNSVYFSAGQGFAWETSVPQGIVSIISGVTGSNYVLKEG